MVKDLAKGHKCENWDITPYSGDQKHQSLKSSVFDHLATTQH